MEALSPTQIKTQRKSYPDNHQSKRDNPEIRKQGFKKWFFDPITFPPFLRNNAMGRSPTQNGPIGVDIVSEPLGPPQGVARCRNQVRKNRNVLPCGHPHRCCCRLDQDLTGLTITRSKRRPAQAFETYAGRKLAELLTVLVAESRAIQSWEPRAGSAGRAAISDLDVIVGVVNLLAFLR